MKEMIFDCEVTTPMFLGDADKRPEIRPPSFRGAMRWWFRALEGGARLDSVPDLVDVVRDAEKIIFGNTEAAGNFAIRIDGNVNNDDVSRFGFRDQYVRYLGYGLGEKDKEREFIHDGKKFKLKLLFKATAEPDQERKVLGAFWMLAHFGNVGARSTRGFGGFKIVAVDGTNGSTFPTPNKNESLLDFLNRGIHTIAQNFNISSASTKSSVPNFSVVHPAWWSSILIPLDNQISNPVDGLRYIGESLREFREDRAGGKFSRGGTFSYYHSKQYSVAHSFFASPRTMSMPNWSVFGLPHPYQFRTGDKLRIIAGNAKRDNNGEPAEKRSRRMSPLHIKVVKWQSRHYVLLQKFEAKFVDKDIIFQNAAKGQGGDFEVVSGNPGFGLIDSFMSQFKGGVIRI